MEANVPKRKEPPRSLRIKVISMGNAEVGKVSTACREGRDLRVPERHAYWLREQPLNNPKPRLPAGPGRLRRKTLLTSLTFGLPAPS